MLTLDRFRCQLTGELLTGFLVRNADRLPVAIGAYGQFVVIKHPRYARDSDLCRRVVELAGLQSTGQQVAADRWQANGLTGEQPTGGREAGRPEAGRVAALADSKGTDRI